MKPVLMPGATPATTKPRFRARALALVSLASLFSIAAVGCHSGAEDASLAHQVDALRQGPSAKDAREFAPQAFLHAEEERKAAEAEAGHDELAREAHLARAVAAYTHAFVLARLARATADLGDAEGARAEKSGEETRLHEARTVAEREGKDLEKQRQIAEAATLPPTSAKADAKREAARKVAARALTADARLLCAAARLVQSDAPGLADADRAVLGLDKQVDPAAGAQGNKASNKQGENSEKSSDAKNAGSLIDRAARARANCLASLTKARRDKSEMSAVPGHADTLLAELSEAAGWDPHRDERGVVVTLAHPFGEAGNTTSAALNKDAKEKLVQLGKVAQAHPLFFLQIALHSASAPRDAKLSAERAEAVKDALKDTLQDKAAKVDVEIVGTDLPLADPNDAAHRLENERVDVIFVGPQN